MCLISCQRNTNTVDLSILRQGALEVIGTYLNYPQKYSHRDPLPLKWLRTRCSDWKVLVWNYLFSRRTGYVRLIKWHSRSLKHSKESWAEVKTEFLENIHNNTKYIDIREWSPGTKRIGHICWRKRWGGITSRLHHKPVNSVLTLWKKFVLASEK